MLTTKAAFVLTASDGWLPQLPLPPQRPKLPQAPPAAAAFNLLPQIVFCSYELEVELLFPGLPHFYGVLTDELPFPFPHEISFLIGCGLVT